MIAASSQCAYGFALRSAPTQHNPAGPHRAAVACTEASDQFPQTVGSSDDDLFAKMKDRGPGMAMLFHLEDLKQVYVEVSGATTKDGAGEELPGLWIDPNVSMSQVETLQAKIGGGAAPAEEVMETIERVQGIRHRGEDDEPLIYFEQWVKFLADSLRK